MTKSASYYDRKAWDYTNTGNWAARDEMRRLARKARAVAKKRQMPNSVICLTDEEGGIDGIVTGL